MSRGQSNDPDRKMLPPGGDDAGDGPAPTISPERQLQEMPRDELRALAEEYGLDATRYPTPQQLVVAIHERRQMIASLDRDAMLDVIRWGRRPVPLNASKEQLAQ